MAYTVQQLITDAFYTSSVLSQELETISGYQIAQGLRLLNQFLSVKSANSTLIPYNRVFDFNLRATVGEYFIQDLVKADSMCFFLNNVRFPLEMATESEFFATARIEGIDALPFQWNQQRVVGGSNIRVYFEPQADYPAQIVGKFAFTKIVNLQEDLDELVDDFYIFYMTYGLANYISNAYNMVLPIGAMTEYKKLEQQISGITPIDFRLKKISSLGGDYSVNWAFANVSNGWVP